MTSNPTEYLRDMLNLAYLKMKDIKRGGLKSMHHIDFEDKYGIEVN